MPNKLRRGIASLRLELLQSYGFMARNWHLTKRYWGWEVVWFFYSLTSGLSVVFIAQGAEALTGQAPGFDVQYLTMYLIIGTLVGAICRISSCSPARSSPGNAGKARLNTR